MQENLTEVVIVLDRSGSMKSVTDETIGGYNQFIQGQKEVPGACNVTLVQFDNEYECVYAGKPLAEVPEMTRETFVPRGYTALLDAIGKTIKDTSARILAMQKSLRPAKVLMVIITDGGENASKEYEYKNVHSMIKDLRATNWEFVFLAANIDVADYAEKMGIHSGNAARYTSDKNGTKAALRSLNLGTARYRGGMSASVDDFWQKK
jgi:hypothetical protein